MPRVEERVSVWIDPWEHAQTSGYQIIQALYSISNGGFGGTGFGKGTFENTGGGELIPYLHTDFIYAALSQELGLVGAAALLLVYMLFCLRGFRIAMLAQDGFSKLLAVGLTFGFALQTFIIVGGVLRIIPLTGITLPFVSYGGSSIVANFLLLAGLLLVSHRANSSGQLRWRIALDFGPLRHSACPPGRCKARSRRVLSRARSLRLRTLPASLRERLFAAGERALRRR